MNGGIPSQTGAVLDEEARSAVTVAFWGVRLSGYAGEIADRAIDALAPHVAALVARARAEGAAEERERIAGFCDQMAAPGLDDLHRAAYEHVARVARTGTT